MKFFYALFYAFLTLAIACPATAPAQALVDNVTASGAMMSLHSTARSWEKQQDHINGRVSRGSLEKMKATTDAIADRLQNSDLIIDEYTPVWHGEYFPEKTGSSSLSRCALSCSFVDNNSSKADLLIMANDISPMLQSIQLNGHDLKTLHPAANTKTDCPYFEFSNAELRLKFWLVSNDNTRLPYTPLTRREYLQEAAAGLLAEKNSIIDRIKEQTPVRPSSVQEAEKKSAIDEINNTWTGAEREVRMRVFLKHYLTDEEYLKQSIEKHTAGLDSTIHFMDSLSHQPAADLNKAAIVPDETAAFSGFQDGNPDAVMLIKPNPSFANPYGSSDKPQFLLVGWRYNPNDEKAADLDKSFSRQFAPGQLRDLLEK